MEFDLCDSRLFLGMTFEKVASHTFNPVEMEVSDEFF